MNITDEKKIRRHSYFNNNNNKKSNIKGLVHPK